MPSAEYADMDAARNHVCYGMDPISIVEYLTPKLPTTSKEKIEEIAVMLSVWFDKAERYWDERGK